MNFHELNIQWLLLLFFFCGVEIFNDLFNCVNFRFSDNNSYMIDSRILIAISLRAALLVTTRSHQKGKLCIGPSRKARVPYDDVYFTIFFMNRPCPFFFFYTKDTENQKKQNKKRKDQPREISSFSARITLLTQFNWNWACLLANFKVFSTNIWHCFSRNSHPKLPPWPILQLTFLPLSIMMGKSILCIHSLHNILSSWCLIWCLFIYFYSMIHFKQ